jgi:trehalose 6-phosphate phosphatase
VSVPPPLAELARAPGDAALLLDVDGTLAPIVPRPEDARVPEETRAELRRLAGRYALVACISGRPSEEARRIVGVETLTYVGEHGLELEPEAERWASLLAVFADRAEWPAERKRLTLSFHWRMSQDERAAISTLERVAEQARDEGLVPRWGRKVLEVRPPIDAHKGTAVAHLLGARDLRRALYAGDDTTDLDAFAALAELELGVRLAVASAEAPPELREAADVVVGSPAELLELLRQL